MAPGRHAQAPRSADMPRRNESKRTAAGRAAAERTDQNLWVYHHRSRRSKSLGTPPSIAPTETLERDIAVDRSFRARRRRARQQPSIRFWENSNTHRASFAQHKAEQQNSHPKGQSLQDKICQGAAGEGPCAGHARTSRAGLACGFNIRIQHARIPYASLACRFSTRETASGTATPAKNGTK